MSPYKAVSGYTTASGAQALSTSGYTPQLQIIDTGSTSFSAIVGLAQGTYPPSQQTVMYAAKSNLVPQLDPIASVVVGVSNIYNLSLITPKYCTLSRQQAFHTVALSPRHSARVLATYQCREQQTSSQSVYMIRTCAPFR
ncbi:hypothetical protein L916_17546 [Phytophthora nicotianae]|uniref:Uncharacterized protein n=1 Tax=Phytophthora nicotianae TaxID=4792 RepID=W2I523_PHYNI|nr:hypothetical protein L916_17546 [Phytophthora nicotianae]